MSDSPQRKSLAKTAEAIREGMGRLDGDVRQATELRYFQGLSYGAIAAEMGIEEALAKGLADRGQRQLISYLKATGITPF